MTEGQRVALTYAVILLSGMSMGAGVTAIFFAVRTLLEIRRERRRGE